MRRFVNKLSWILQVSFFGVAHMGIRLLQVYFIYMGLAAFSAGNALTTLKYLIVVGAMEFLWKLVMHSPGNRAQKNAFWHAIFNFVNVDSAPQSSPKRPPPEPHAKRLQQDRPDPVEDDSEEESDPTDLRYRSGDYDTEED